MPYIPQGPFNINPAGNTFWYHQRGGSCNYPGPHQRGTERYVCWSKPIDESNGDLHIWRSADAGLTWNAVVVAPVVMSILVATERLDADTLRICYGGTPPDEIGTGGPCIRDFDMATNTLGPVLYNTDAYILEAPLIAGYHRSTVAAEDRIFATAAAGFGRKLMLYRYSGGAFLAPIEITDNVIAGNLYCECEAIFMDPAGTSHIIYSGRPRAGAQTPRNIYYRQVDASGAMTAAVLVYSYVDDNFQTFGFPALLGNLLICPFPVGAAGLFTGSMLVMDPYTAPAPTITQVAIPTEYLSQVFTSNSGSIHASALGPQLYLWWLEELALDTVTPLSRIMYVTYDGGPMAAPSVFHDQIANPAPFDAPGAPMQYLSQPLMDVVDPMLLVGMSGFIGGFAIGPTSFYWFSIAGAPPLPTQILTQGSRRMHILVPNRFDGCLASDVKLHEIAGPKRACCLDTVYSDIVNVRAPANSIPFRKVNAIPTPLAASGDVIALDFQVPQGYDGLVSGCFNVYTGPGFAEGGGDIEWRILVNKVYAVQLGRILVTLGSRAQSYPVDGGIQIQSGQRIQYIVNVPNLSGGILPLASQIVCGLEGLFYARQ